MSFEIPYKTLTAILGDKAPYNPSEETTPMFMNGKFNELLENDKSLENQINVLVGENASYSTESIIQYIKTMSKKGIKRGGFRAGNSPKLPNEEKNWMYGISFYHVEGNWYEVEAVRSLSNDIYRCLVDINTLDFVKGWERISKGNMFIEQLDIGTDILNASIDDGKFPLMERKNVRVFNSPTSPYALGDDDFIYEVIKTSDNKFYRIIAHDMRSTNTFINSRVNDVYTGWKQQATATQVQAIQEQLNATQEMLVGMMKMEG